RACPEIRSAKQIEDAGGEAAWKAVSRRGRRAAQRRADHPGAWGFGIDHLARIEAAAAEDVGEGAGEDSEVEARRAVLDVPVVELDPLTPGDPGPAVDLRPSGDPRA